MNYQEKQDILVDSFKKLDENRKEHIRELTAKLAEIHCTAEFRGEFDGNKLENSENWGICPPLADFGLR